jgi:hypothetical protein
MACQFCRSYAERSARLEGSVALRSQLRRTLTILLDSMVLNTGIEVYASAQLCVSDLLILARCFLEETRSWREF